uniref:Uncharacterized protein n=1 Tax=Anguilla anguilla TaxID=7936 RepID=A0A0E9VA56_ANGAN
MFHSVVHSVVLSFLSFLLESNKCKLHWVP